MNREVRDFIILGYCAWFSFITWYWILKGDQS